MKSTLYIPKKIKVGFQNRKDTYSGKLAYIIYFDDKNVLRKEKSWEGWRDKNIDPIELDNKPSAGFTLNKGVQRYGHWRSSGRSLCRIFDERIGEFEISIDNLLFSLMCYECNKKGLDGEFVYAWDDKDLILLPTNCEEYKEAMGYTALQAGKITSKDLNIGCSYRSKKSGDYIYLGKFDYYSQRCFSRRDYGNSNTDRVKKFIFAIDTGEVSKNKPYRYSINDVTSLDFLSSENSDIPVENYAELLEEFTKMPNSSKAVEFIEIPYEFRRENTSYSSESKAYIKVEDNKYKIVNIKYNEKYNYTSSKYELVNNQCEVIVPEGCYVGVDEKGLYYRAPQEESYDYNYYRYSPKWISIEKAKEMGLVHLTARHENGNIHSVYRY